MTFVSYDFGVGDSRYEIGDSCYEVGDTCFWEKKFIIIFFNIKSTKKKNIVIRLNYPCSPQLLRLVVCLCSALILLFVSV